MNVSIKVATQSLEAIKNIFITAAEIENDIKKNHPDVLNSVEVEID